ncbi:MAG: ligase-associated DNA damage response endonuclease PdeM [Cyclobacteriaceae bacterium]|nr:ligase-associated DNA damage response endonuclease PdeM [Cyclobacteriaceae bacterium]
MKVSLYDCDIELLPEKAIYLPLDKTLVVGDLHFGKASHFRRAGLPVPVAANRKSTELLIDLLNKTKPRTTIFLGDLFHSTYNDEWESVGQVVKHFKNSSFELVLGNHDIMSERQYIRHGIQVLTQKVAGCFLFTHEPMEKSDIPAGVINVSGHLHPGARLLGKGRQSVMLPCFWCAPQQFILPSFGSLTGLMSIRPGENDRVFIIVENSVQEIVTQPKESKARITR